VTPPEPNVHADPLLAYRARFPILSRTNYLISNSLGAVPAEVSQSLQEYYDAGRRAECAPGKKAGG
jgi:kynureninase